MDVFTCDPRIIPSTELNDRIGRKVKRAQIVDQFSDSKEYGGYGDSIPVAIKNQMEKIRQRMVKLDSYWEIHETPITSHRRYIGKAIVFAKKAFRKLTRWMVMPYLVQLNRFHYDTVRMLDEMIELQEMMIEVEEKKRKV